MEYIPQIWQRARVTFPKVGRRDKALPKSYRLISKRRKIYSFRRETIHTEELYTTTLEQSFGEDASASRSACIQSGQIYGDHSCGADGSHPKIFEEQLIAARTFIDMEVAFETPYVKP